MRPRNEKLQSAMEYLMTYGWSILIIAVVISALFYSGAFSNLQTLPLVCLGTPSFLCSNPIMSSSGALTINFGYIGSYPITITGLACNITPPTKPPSIETTHITVPSNSRMNLTFQCPIARQAKLGTTLSVILWFYYDTPSASGLQQLYAKGIVYVNYHSLLWNVTEWTPSSNSVNLIPYSWVTSNPETPINTANVATTIWSSLIENGKEGWSYSTDYHNHDIYYNVETTLFPVVPLSLDNAPCNYPYSAHGYTAITYASMGGTYNFIIMSDDATEIFYRLVGSGTWQSVYSGSAWIDQAPTSYTQILNIPQGTYEIAVNYMDTCDPAGLSTVLISPPPTPA